MGSEASETAWWPSLCDTSPTSVTKRAIEASDDDTAVVRHANDALVVNDQVADALDGSDSSEPLFLL